MLLKILNILFVALLSILHTLTNGSPILESSSNEIQNNKIRNLKNNNFRDVLNSAAIKKRSAKDSIQYQCPRCHVYYPCSIL